MIAIAALFSLSSVAFAKNETGGQGTAGNQTGSQESTAQEQQQVVVSPSPAGNQVQGKNQVVTQNQGEDSQLQTNTQEMESEEANENVGSGNRNEAATENMSQVAEKVQELLQLKTAGGIGQQVKQIAQEQNQAQDQIQEQISKLNAKGKVARFLTGTDRPAVTTLKQQLEENKMRIQQLEQLENQLTNQSDITQVQETIQLLSDQNITLQDRINLEEKSSGLFGWLVKLLAK